MSKHIENPQGQTLGSTREPGDQLSHEDSVAVRVRETSSGGRMGRGLSSRSHKRDLSAADILPSVSKVSPLLPAQFGSVQGEVTEWSGERGQTSLETHQRATHEQSRAGEALAEATSLRARGSRVYRESSRTLLTRAGFFLSAFRTAPLNVDGLLSLVNFY